MKISLQPKDETALVLDLSGDEAANLVRWLDDKDIDGSLFGTVSAWMDAQKLEISNEAAQWLAEHDIRDEDINEEAAALLCDQVVEGKFNGLDDYNAYWRWCQSQGKPAAKVAQFNAWEAGEKPAEPLQVEERPWTSRREIRGTAEEWFWAQGLDPRKFSMNGLYKRLRDMGIPEVTRNGVRGFAVRVKKTYDD